LELIEMLGIGQIQQFLSKISLKDDLKKFVTGKVLWAQYGTVVIFAYFLASVISSFLGGMLSSQSVQVLVSKTKSLKSMNIMAPSASPPNYVKVERAILGRNLFNSEGVFPDEKKIDRSNQKSAVFDIEAACQTSTLGIELLGTIYLGRGRKSGSVATIQEKGFSQADVYQVDDIIIGNEQASIIAIEPRQVILNNSGTKECLKLKKPSRSSSSNASSSSTKQGDSGRITTPDPTEAGEYTLEASYVEKQVGEGGGKILTQGRLVPFNKDGQMQGFKMIGLKSAGLFAKIGMKNNDVITQVNDTSLLQPDQGFAFYQAFENETEITINLIRNGQPMSVKVNVK
jgi:type II secretion system protein C